MLLHMCEAQTYTWIRTYALSMRVWCSPNGHHFQGGILGYGCLFWTHSDSICMYGQKLPKKSGRHLWMLPKSMCMEGEVMQALCEAKRERGRGEPRVRLKTAHPLTHILPVPVSHCRTPWRSTAQTGISCEQKCCSYRQKQNRSKKPRTPRICLIIHIGGSWGV